MCIISFKNVLYINDNARTVFSKMICDIHIVIALEALRIRTVCRDVSLYYVMSQLWLISSYKRLIYSI